MASRALALLRGDVIFRSATGVLAVYAGVQVRHRILRPSFGRGFEMLSFERTSG
jgi:hypothetical protein